jgi:hypothetical protein
VAYLRHARTRSRDYATAVEAVFSPCRAEPSSAVPWWVAHRLALPRLLCCQATAINTWMTQEWGGHVTASAVTSRVLRVTQQLKHRWKGRFPRVRSRVYKRDWSSFTSSSRWEIAVVLVSSRRALWRVLMWREDLCVIFGVCDLMRLL